MKLLTLGGSHFQEIEDNRIPLSVITTRTNTLTNLVQTDGSAIALPVDTAVAFNVQIAGRGTSGNNVGKVAYYIQNDIAKNIGGTMTLVGGLSQPIALRVEEVTSWNFAIVPIGGTLLFQVSGDTGTVVSWKAIAQLVYV